MKTIVLSSHRCQFNTGIEQMNILKIQIRALTTRCLLVRVNVDIQTFVYIFEEHTLKTFNSFWNTKIPCYLLTSSAQNSNQYLSVDYFSTPVLI